MASERGVRVRLIGRPGVSRNGMCVEFPTRKTAAVLFHLATHPGTRIERRVLAGLLWSDAGESQAAASLRKAISHLSRLPATADLVGKDRTHVWFSGDPFRTDLALFNRCLVSGTTASLRQALELWRGEPLAELETGSELFDEWVQAYRAATTELAVAQLSKSLSALPLGHGDVDHERALCELIVRIEPTDTAANVRLIRALAAAGDVAGATRRFRAFARALAEIDVAVPQDLTEFVAALAEGGPAGPVGERRTWPTVAILRPTAPASPQDRCAVAHSELLLQLSRFRSLRCFDTADRRRGNGSTEVAVLGEAPQDYRVVLWDQPERDAVFVRCVNARSGHTVTCARLDSDVLADEGRVRNAIAACVNGIERDILQDERPSDTVFGRWVEAFSLMSQWTRTSDVAALRILEDLARDDLGRRLGRVHASIGSILMIQRLIVPHESEADREKLERAREWINRAIAVDHLEPFSHVVLGWLRVQSGEHDRALAAFGKALELNPYSSRTMISAAEAHAYCGKLDRAHELALQAVDCFGPGMPADVHCYLANIAYLSGRLEECLHHLDRAPDNLHTALLAVAVHQERGDAAAAAAARVRFDQEMRRAKPEARLDGPGLTRWIESATMIGSDHQRRRMFAALERAGVMVPGAGHAAAGAASLS